MKCARIAQMVERLPAKGIGPRFKSRFWGFKCNFVDCESFLENLSRFVEQISKE